MRLAIAWHRGDSSPLNVAFRGPEFKSVDRFGAPPRPPARRFIPPPHALRHGTKVQFPRSAPPEIFFRRVTTRSR